MPENPDDLHTTNSCDAWTIVSPWALEPLAQIKRRFHQLNPLATCDLQGGHIGPQLSLGKTDSTGMDHWVELTNQRVVAIPACGAPYDGPVPDDTYDDDLPFRCWLPKGHDARHQWR